MTVAAAVRTVAPAPPVYAKPPATLRIGPANDSLEAEADRAADAVLRGESAVVSSASGGEVRRKCAACESEDEGEPTVRLKRAAQHSAPTSMAAPLNLGPGRPLSADQRAYFEPRFGHDFGGVRVHDDQRSATSAEAVSALAYTAGQHVVFARGQFDPHSARGLKLLAHELAHTVQQRGGAATRLLRSPAPVDPDAVKQLEEVNRRLLVADYPGRDRDLAIKEALEVALRPDDEEDDAAVEPSTAPPPPRDLITTYRDPRSDYGDKVLKELEDERVRKEREEFISLITDRTEATRPRRYNLNLQLQGKGARDEVSNVVFDPNLITLEEFDEERRIRGEAKMRACRQGWRRQGTVESCRVNVKTEYYGKDYMERSFAAVRAAWADGAYIERIKNMGPAGLVGRGVGRGIDYFAGTNVWEERLGLVGDIGDVSLPIYAGSKARGRVSDYQGSGGLETGPAEIIDLRNAPAPQSLANVLEESPAGRFLTEARSRQEASQQKFGVPAHHIGMALESRPLSAEAGRTLRSLGATAEDNIAFNEGEQVWVKINRGEAKIDAYLQLSGDKLIAGIRSAKSESEKVSIDMIKGFYAFRQSANALARQTNATTLRLEADVVINEKEVPKYLERLKFTEKPDTPYSYYLEIPVR
jgi:hypothetical protein